jgi:hypothetical protein
MKKILLVFAFIALAHTNFYGQTTRADVEKLFTETGITMSAITKVYITNITQFYTDGSSRRVELFYDQASPDGKGKNTFSLTDTGFKMIFEFEGKKTAAHLIPFTNMVSFDLYTDYIKITLRD